MFYNRRAQILAFVSIKGGVGKTTLAVETATALAKYYNKKVLLVDANFSAPNIGLYLDLTRKSEEDGIKEFLGLQDALLGIGLHNTIYEAHGFDVVPAVFDYKHDVDIFKLKKILEKVRYRYDFIILDSAPNYEELKPVIAAADKIFIVTSADEMTLTTSLRAAKTAQQNKTPVHGIIVNRIRSPKHEMNIGEIENMAGNKIPVLARIKDNKKMASSLFHKEPLVVHDEFGNFSKEIKNFVSALCGTPENPGFFENILNFSGYKKIFGKEKINRDLYRKNFYTSESL